MSREKSVLITGGNKGIGLAATKLFGDAGFTVYVLARNFEDFSLKDQSNIEMVEYDLADVEGIPDLISKLPRIDILINNAGVMFAHPYDNYPPEKIEKILRVNLEAPVALITEISKTMLSNGFGRIVNNASIAGETGHPDVWYGVTKAGIINLTKSFAKLLGPGGIVVNAVAAGPVETDMLEIIPEPRKEAILNSVYTGRFAYPEEVAETIFWLATDCPEYINGTCIDVNNGAFPR